MDGMLCSSAPLPTWCTTLRMSDASTKRNLLFINNDLGQAIGLVRARRPTQLERIGDWNTRSLANCRRSANRYKMEDDEKMDIMRKAFQMFDTQKTGFIETLRLKTILNSMGQMFEESELQALIDDNDPEDTGKVNFDGFCNIAAHFLEEEDAEAIQKELKEAFRLYDREGNGYITTSTLKEILAALDDKLSSSDLDGIIAEIDTDGSGTVDFDEFMEMMAGE